MTVWWQHEIIHVLHVLKKNPLKSQISKNFFVLNDQTLALRSVRFAQFHSKLALSNNFLVVKHDANFVKKFLSAVSVLFMTILSITQHPSGVI